MAVAFRASSESHATSGSVTATIPGTVQAGDLLVLVGGLNNGGNTAYNWAAPAGWTKRDDRAAGSNLYAAVYVKVAVSGDAGSTAGLTSATTGKSCAIVAAYSGVDPTAPIDVVTGFTETASSTGHATPTVSTNLDQDLVIIAAVQTNSVTESWSTATGYTKRQDSIDNASLSGHVTATVQDTGPVSIGTYGGDTLTAAGASAKAATWTIAISPKQSTQTSRPISDITITNAVGVPTPGGGSGVYADLAADDDAHYAQIDSAGVVETGMGTVTDPNSSSGYVVSYRARYAAGAASGTVAATLEQGTTSIASWTDTLTASFQTFTHTLTSGQANAITDHTALRMKFVPTVS